MKRIGLIALAALALTACDKGDTFTVKGTIEGAKDKTLCLQNKTLRGAVILDSVKLGEDGHFEFQAKAPATPDFYQLTLDGQSINFSIDSTETVSITARQPGMGSNYEVSGSDNCEKIRQLALKQQALQQNVQTLINSSSLSRGEMADSLNRMVAHFKEDVAFNYIYQSPASTYAYYALFLTLGGQNIYDRQNANDLKAFAAVATSWDTFYPESDRSKHLHSTAIKGLTDNRIATAREQQMAFDESKVVNTGVLNLELADAKGHTHTLTELKGQVVLLDFHVFSTKESAARILQLRELYNKYHAQGLEIYQVSLDADEHLWKQATQALPWICVYDPNGASAMRYNVQTIPEYFLIDRDNTLQKRSSQIDDLEKAIKGYL
ncbi:MAG: AhpC/TSA family protein [Prevotella sp.]|nr:AhpC/TSA family protein [Prevotella sp.]